MNYPPPTIQRARRAVSCSPFQVALFTDMEEHSVALGEIAHSTGVTRRYTTQAVSERGAERSLLWLIQVGILRREVDGQGLTDSFRLTPLGRLIAQQWQQQGDRFRRVSWGDRLFNWLQQRFSGVV
ncbi:MAG: Npun_F0494 family protein [Thermosynechococcaceae cyanobacterium]